MLTLQNQYINFLIIFIKIPTLFLYWNLNYFLFNFFYLNFFFKNFLFINFKLIKLNIYKNINFFFKTFNNFRKSISYKNKLFNFFFKNNKFFNFSYLNKNNTKKMNKIFLLTIFQQIKLSPFYFYNYKNNFFKNWNFLVGSLISPHSIELNPRKIWFRKNISFSLINNRFFFNLLSKKKNLHNKLKFKNLNSEQISIKKIILNNFFYIIRSNDNKFIKFFLKLNFETPTNVFSLKKKNYDWFLSRPYLFLNIMRFFKSNKMYANFFVFFIFKKYLKLFNTLKKSNYNYKYKKTSDFFFKKIFYNADVLSKTYRNKNNIKYKLLTNNLTYYTNNNINLTYYNFFLKKKKKNLKLRIKYNYIFFSILKSKILKKNKFFLNINFFNVKLRFIKFSRRIKKINFFLKSFILFKKLKFEFFKYFKNNKKIFKYFNKLFNYSKVYKCFINFKKNLILKIIFTYKPIISVFFNKYFFISLDSNLIYSLNFNNNLNKSYIFLKIKKPIFNTKSKNNFTLNSYGFFFLNNCFFNYRNSLQNLYNLKKTMYSFSYKNEVQRFILKRYSKMFLISNNFYKNYFFNNENNSVIDLILYTKSISLDHLFYKNSNVSILLNKFLNFSNNWTFFKNQLISSTYNYKDNSDFNIKRVKFKPGYMNLWRNARTVLKNSLFLKMRYQYKLTNYLSKYNKFLYFKTSISLEMRLLNIIIKSRLFNDWATSLLFIENNTIYVNGLICSNPNFQLFVNDFIQTVVCYKYYILSKWLLNLNLKKKIKIKKVLRKKSSNSYNSDEKKKSFTLPKWILFNKNLIDDVPNFLEVDLFTLSVFIIYEPFNWSDINIYNIIDQKFNIINLYNWKYIT